MQSSDYLRNAEMNKQVPDEIQSPDVLRKAPIPDVDLPDLSLTNDILEIVTKQKPIRKRRLSADISLRLESTAKQRRMENKENIYEDSGKSSIQHSELPSFDANANDVEMTQPPVAEAKTPRILIETISSKPKDLDFIELALLQKTPLQKLTNAKALKSKKNSKLIIDKQTKVKDEVLKNNMENYQMKLTVKSPMETFNWKMHQLKSSNEMFFASPSSCLKRSARQLLPIYQRNLERIVTRLFEDDKVSSPSPAKKRFLPKNKPILAASVNENEPEILEVPDIIIQALEVNHEPIVPLQSIELEDIPSFELPNSKPDKIVQKRVDDERNVAGNIGEYQEV